LGEDEPIIEPSCRAKGRFDLTDHHRARSGQGFFERGGRLWIAGLLSALGFLFLAGSPASAETRTLKLFFIHTKERAEIVYKRNGRYDAAGLKKINQFLRDWRRNEPTKMDPRLLDLVWEAYQQSGARDYIHVVSAYRSPATNSMLRKRSKGVANKSQHMLGKAMDFYIPGVKLKKLREVGLRMQGGGVGYYPSSGSPFVHFDVGNVRHWPKMSRKELVAVFPNGKTLHVPSDGKPLPGFEQAVAAYKSRKSSGELAIASASSSKKSKGGNLLATLFGGGGADEEEESGGIPEEAVEVKPKAKPKAEVKAKPAEPEKPGIKIVPPELAQPASLPPAEEPAPVQEALPDTPEAVIASLSPSDVPLPQWAPRPENEPQAVDAVAEMVAEAAQAAPAAIAEEAPAELAAGVPLPTWRPESRRPEATPAAQPETDAAVLMALAEQPATLEKAETLVAPIPAARPDAPAVATVAALAEGFLPSREPAPALPETAAVPGLSPADGEPTTVASLQPALPSRSDLPASMASRGHAASFSEVKTTGKAARPTRRDLKPEPKPVVVAAQPDAARWALQGDAVAARAKGARAPAFAQNLVRTAPREVYTTGFQPSGQAAPANRFTGSAVTFLSVARFE
jgi:uncharacterized protein YcbK (DUF882 family)